ncbi:VOC family protein [Actinoplanes sp. NPDC024001]|uniref:VOC family protein n=1 Tax=Actinoplanes sp. NPDC024001 TaxID=3154598 RepID=UPI0033E77D95
MTGKDIVLVLDCADLDRSAAFWCEVLDYRAEPGGTGRYRRLLPAGRPGVELLLQRVPEPKTDVKNRLHLDLRVPDLTTEVARVIEAGGRQVTDTPVVEDGWTWHVLADPDGNEFCVLQPPLPK